MKWLSVEHASILGSLNSVIKLSLFCCKERSALKLFSRERKIRLFLPRRKILLNPYLRENAGVKGKTFQLEEEAEVEESSKLKLAEASQKICQLEAKLKEARRKIIIIRFIAHRWNVEITRLCRKQLGSAM